MASSTKRDKDKPQAIQVFVRSRPLSKQEQEARSSTCIQIKNSKELTVKQQYDKHYAFDKVFGPNVGQRDVYASVVEPLISEVLAGYNCTVFAYGQTGTGKTYTMAGGSVTAAGSWQDDPEAGIIPRTLSHLFDELHLLQQQFTVRVSYLELYNEELFDLLSDNVEGRGIRLFEDQHQKGSVIIHGIIKETVYNKHQVYEILQKGQDKRRTAATLINAQSSRSHTVFSIMVHTCETTVDGEELVKTGKLNLVDLAGSENIGRSGAIDRRAREAGSINQSLLTLGRVIKALVERREHIPYRESKLTRILKDSLGGNTKTVIIATISPATTCLEETSSTLDYANRARNITNKPEVNQRVSQKTWKAQYEKEIESLRKDLHAARTGSGVYLDQQNYDKLVYDTEIRKEELAEKIAVVRGLEQQLRNLEEQHEIQAAEWRQVQLSFEATRNKLTQYKTKLQKTLTEKKEQEYLASYYGTKAETLHEQAQYFFGMTKLHATEFLKKIDTLHTVSRKNKDSLKKVSEKVIDKCEEIISELMDFMINLINDKEHVANVMRGMEEQQLRNSEKIQANGYRTVNQARNFVNVACQDLENAYGIDLEQREKMLEKIQAKLQEVEEMTSWVDIKIDLVNVREGLLSHLNNTNEELHNQQELIKDMTEEVGIIKEELTKSMNRLDLLNEKLVQSKDINSRCMLNVNSAQKIAEQMVSKISSDLQISVDQAAYLLAEVADTIKETKQQDITTEKVLVQLQQCRKNFGKTSNIVDTDQHHIETYMQNLNSIIENNVKAAKESVSQFNCKSEEIQKRLSNLNQTASRHKLTLTSGLHECRETLVNFTNSGLIDLSSGGSTPARMQFDPSSLAQPSPKERILSRFRDQHPEQSLDGSIEFDRTIPSPPTEDQDILQNILQPNVLHVESQEKNSLTKKSPKCDKENVPGLSWDTP